MGGHGPEGGGPSGVAGGMRRRPIDVTRKLPLIRSQKELALDDDTKVAVEVRSARSAPTREGMGPGYPHDAPRHASRRANSDCGLQQTCRRRQSRSPPSFGTSLRPQRAMRVAARARGRRLGRAPPPRGLSPRAPRH